MLATSTDRTPEARRWPFIAVGALVGCAVGLAALHPAFIAGTGGKWLRPENDFSAYLVAWNYFVVDTWRFPLFSIPAMGYPEGGSILFNDALPLTALPTKAIYALSGFRLNPFGWWILLTYVLQGAMAVRLVCAVGVRSPVASLGVAVLTVCANPFMWRMEHTAISSHFLILWALALYFENVRNARLRLGELWLLSAISLLINSYLFAMVMVLHAVTMLTLWRANRLTVREVRMAMWGLAAVVSIGVVAGYGVFLTNPSSMKGSGFGYFSWNLAALAFPPGLGISRDATGGQYEGEAYLGLGALLVLLCCLVTRPRAILRHAYGHPVLCSALVFLTAYAASNKIYFGNTLVWSYYLPPGIEDLGNYFRGNGRFIWPVAYALLVLPVAVLFRSWHPTLAGVVVMGAVIAQVYEAVPAIRHFRVATSQAQPDLIDSERLSHWIGEHQRLWQYPSWTCGGLAGAARSWGSLEANRELQVQLLAARLGVGTNSVYTSRVLKNCDVELKWGEFPRLKPGVLYVLSPEAPALAPAVARLAASEQCIPLAWAIVCSRSFPAAQAAPMAGPPVDPAAPEVDGTRAGSLRRIHP